MATAFFGGDFFGGEFFYTGDDDEVLPSGGKGDNERSRRTLHTFKPTGLLGRRIPEGRKDVEERVEQAREVQAEVSEQLAREFVDESASAPPVAQMSLREIEAEIGAILQKKIRTEDDEMMLLMLIAYAA